MPYAIHDTMLIQKHYIQDDMDLCQLLETMNLGEEPTERNATIVPKPRPNTKDEIMGMEGDQNFKPVIIMPEQLSSLEGLRQEEPPRGCAYLRAIWHQLEWGTYPTTGGEYIDAIFTHREILFSQLAAHQDCALAFSNLADMLEKRVWRSDRDDDSEAVAAFRHEAWVVASAC